MVTDDLERSRATVIFRLLLAIPHLIVVSLWGFAAAAVTVIIWFALIFEGKAPRSLQGFVVSYLRYSVHVSSYLYLAAGPYPAFGGGKGYPVDVAITPSTRQSRGRVAARFFLAIPVLMLAAAVGGGLWFMNASWVASEDRGVGWSADWLVLGGCLRSRRMRSGMSAGACCANTGQAGPKAHHMAATAIRRQ